MGTLHWLIPLVLLILSLSPPVSFGQTQRDPKEKDIKSLFFNPKVGPEEIKRVAVLSVRSVEEGFRHASRIEDLLLTNLKTVGKYDILSAKDVKGLVEKRGIDWTKRHHYPKALEIGKFLGVDGLIVGSLSEYGTMGDRAHFALNLRMIRIPEGDTAWSMSCAARGKPKAMEDVAEGAIGSIVRTLIHRWRSDEATTAWGIKLQPLEAWGGYSHIILRIPQYEEADIEEYIVSRGTSESGPYAEIKRLDTKKRVSLSFKDDDVQADRSYFYHYRVVTKMGFLSPLSEPVSATTRGIPLAPQGLKAKAGMVKSVSIEWTRPPDPEVRGYIVYRSLSPEGPFEEIQKIKGERKTSFLDRGPLKKKLTDGSLYYYKVRSYNKVDVLSPESEMVSARTKKVPRTPGELNALGGQARRISLTWRANPEKDIKHYVVYRSDDAGEGFNKIKTVPGGGTDFIDTKRSDGATYYYKMKAVDADGLESEFSEVVSATTKRVPSNPRGIKAEGTRRKVIISWEANPEADISRYHIYRKTVFGFKKIGSTEGTSYTDEKLRDGKTYTYKLTAEDKDGLESPFSGEISATTAPK